MYGRELLIHGERNRAGAIMLICTVADADRSTVLEIPAWMFDAAACCYLRRGSAPSVSVDALRLLGRTLQTALDVIEAQHQSTASGGLDAQSQASSNSTTGAVSNHDTDPAVASRDQPQNSVSCSPSAAPTRRSRVRSQGSGALPGVKSSNRSSWNGRRFSTFVNHRGTRSYIIWKARSFSTPCRNGFMIWAGAKWKWLMTI